MARGPDGQGGGAGFSLADQLFNAQSIGDLAREFAVLPGFDAGSFQHRAVDGLAARGLLERLDWLADCATPFLPSDFPAMADALEAAMPPPLDPTLTDDDFGRFIHAVPGILAVRHGLENHPERALDLLHAATQRFSMEFYIRPFLDHWPDLTLARLHDWVSDPNYHVRRLVSEGTRPRLPWARAVTLSPDQTLPLLDKLHGDSTRYVTRSVANHLNDISKSDADAVLARLSDWQRQGKQAEAELQWMTRHALRTRVKDGHGPSLRLLGFDPDAPVSCALDIDEPARIGGALNFRVTSQSDRKLPVIVDYILETPTASGGTRRKVFKLKQARLGADTPLTLAKSHRLKAGASTFTLHPGPARLTVQVNGVARASCDFTLIA